MNFCKASKFPSCCVYVLVEVDFEKVPDSKHGIIVITFVQMYSIEFFSRARSFGINPE